MNQLDRNVIEDYCNPHKTLTVAEIYVKYGINQRDLSKIKKEYGIENRISRFNLTMRDKHNIIDRYRDGEVASKIAIDIGCCKGTIHKILRDFNIEHCYRNSVENEMIKAKELYNKNVSLKDMAKILDMSIGNLTTNLYRYIKSNRYDKK